MVVAKMGYDWRKSFEDRTAKALALRAKDTDVLNTSPLLNAAKRFWPYDALLTDDTFKVLLNAVPHLLHARGYRILDVGCGFGRCSPILSAFDCAEYVGIDAMAERIAYATDRYGSKAVRFEQSDIAAFKTDAKFDFVFCCTVLQHLPTEEKFAAIEGMRAALKPTGTLLMCEGQVMVDGNAEEEYAKDTHADHMLPITEAELRAAFAPWELVRDGEWFVGKMGVATPVAKPAADAYAGMTRAKTIRAALDALPDVVSALEVGRLRDPKERTGHSTLLIAEHTKIDRLVTIDVNPDTEAVCQAFIPARPLSKVEFVNDDAMAAIAQLAAEGNSFGFMYLDGPNDAQKCLDILIAATGVAAKGATVILDDTDNPSVAKKGILILPYMAAHPDIYKIVASIPRDKTCHGQTVLRILKGS